MPGVGGMTAVQSVGDFLAECERESGRYTWEGTFGDYLRMAFERPSVSRLSHRLVYDAIMAGGIEESPSGQLTYGLFDGNIFGLNQALGRIVQYFASSADRLEIRKRILLLLGPPASGKSSIVALLKTALEQYTRTEAGTAYAIKGCPMQEDPLHLIPSPMRSKLMEEHGVYVEGELCPRCRYVLKTKYEDKVSDMPVERVTFSEREAVGIGYYVATDPNPEDASILVGSVDTEQLDGGRVEVAGKAFRLDGEFNVANRGLIELVEMFKADRRLLTSLLGLAQEQLIKMERFGSVYADEVIVAHSNEGDFADFASEPQSEALRDRIVAVQIPYNVRVQDEVEIYLKMLKSSALENVHVSPLALPTMSVFAVLSRLEMPAKPGMTLMDKLRLYDGQVVPRFSLNDVVDLQRHHPNEGMHGLSPRYIMNRLSAVASSPDVQCVSPLMALDSLWIGLRENVSLDEGDLAKHLGFAKETVEEYNRRAIREVQRAFKEGFEESGTDLLSEYLASVETYLTEGKAGERDMREMEKHAGVSDRERAYFRREVHQFFSVFKKKGAPYDYMSEPRLKAAIEARLFPTNRVLARDLSRPRFARQRAEWRRRRTAIINRLVTSYGCCARCADDLVEYVSQVLKGTSMLKTPKNEGVEWQWDLNPPLPGPQDD